MSKWIPEFHRLLGLLLIAPLLVAQPQIQNARVETRAASGSLETAFRAIVTAQSDPAWIAYTVPAERNANYWNECGKVRLEGSSEILVLYRIEFQRAERIRTFPTDCSFDAGGLPFYWLTSVDAVQSVELLKSLVPSLPNPAISAMALHRDGVVGLVEIARHGSDGAVRKRALSALSRSKDPRATKFFEEVLAK